MWTTVAIKKDVYNLLKRICKEQNLKVSFVLQQLVQIYIDTYLKEKGVKNEK
ncbi:hypothetical protein OWM07_03200 [Deferribacter thermophilus]|uniref:hypothetical protein n=1 Tax=Deferribacter thermophilus TaxID=53573 RepID=UPI003C1CF511